MLQFGPMRLVISESYDVDCNRPIEGAFEVYDLGS